ncbi:phosphoadenosine phosphosulfate reductase (plasmid) [Streptomyces sp. NA02950]|uniref:phosphoadenosine phosphosulfate reductase n=1 Tax=Streptomyces sp. NA02950 TaxID=2742137 RepID=UPI001590AAE8|nr:phosphoadenosine phosphosulfate reductase [Streptomyces sp. NA02950]QKV98146.1 phosphoadenosine phosphosulfate reductase [Streptomyces sp. NA02950]
MTAQLDLFAASSTGIDPVELAAQQDFLIVNLSGGKDGLRAAAVTRDAARQAGVEDRIWTVHASLGPMEWPACTVDGVRYPSVGELAAEHSRLLGVPPERHLELRRHRDAVPYDLLTFIAERGDWPWLGRARFCTGDWKTKLIFGAFSQAARDFKKAHGRPARMLNVLGLRADESPDRRKRPVLQRTTDNSHRIVDEWLPAHGDTTAFVKEWTDAEGWPHHWAYDSAPGAGDWAGSTRCSCSACVFSNRRDLLLAVARRPRLAALYAEVEHSRGIPFNPSTTIVSVIEEARRPGAPGPGVVLDDDTADFDALETAVRDALTRPPKRKPRPHQGPGTLPALGAGCDGCSLADGMLPADGDDA